VARSQVLGAVGSVQGVGGAQRLPERRGGEAVTLPMAPPGGRRCPWREEVGDREAAEGGSIQREPSAASEGQEGAAALAAASLPPSAASLSSSALHVATTLLPSAASLSSSTPHAAATLPPSAAHAAASLPSSALHAAAAQPSPSSAYPQHAQPR